MYENLQQTSYSMVKDWKLFLFQDQEEGKNVHFYPFYSMQYFEVLAGVIKWLKRNSSNPNCKGKGKISLFAGDIIFLYIKQ
jgi:hypothetical protein